MSGDMKCLNRIGLISSDGFKTHTNSLKKKRATP